MAPEKMAPPQREKQSSKHQFAGRVLSKVSCMVVFMQNMGGFGDNSSLLRPKEKPCDNCEKALIPVRYLYVVLLGRMVCDGLHQNLLKY